MSFAETLSDMDKAPRKSGGLPMVQLEQKQIALMRYIALKYSKHGVMELDCCVGTGATAKECLLEPFHHTITGFDGNCSCVTMMMTSLLTVSAEQWCVRYCGEWGS